MINHERNIRPHGPSSIVLFGGIMGLMTYGFYLAFMANRERRAWKREGMDIRLSVMPFLAAEDDLRACFLDQTRKDYESELMKDKKGFDPEIYKTVWMEPMKSVAPGIF